MFCNNCGKKIVPGTKFCPYCGAKQYNHSNTNIEYNNINKDPHKYHKHHYGWIITVVVLVILIISGYGGYTWYINSPLSMNMEKQLPDNRWKMGLKNHYDKGIKFHNTYTYYPRYGKRKDVVFKPTGRSTGKARIGPSSAYITSNIKFHKINANKYYVTLNKTIYMHSYGYLVKIHGDYAMFNGRTKRISPQLKKGLHYLDFGKHLELIKEN